MGAAALLRQNLLSPIVLAFALGLLARLARSELRVPKDLATSLAIYLLLALGLKGGHELAEAGLGAVAIPAAATLLLGLVSPVLVYTAVRRLGRLPAIDAAAIAAHYGSVSAVTFLAAQQFVAAAGAPAEAFLPTLLALLESPGIHVALAIGAFARAAEAKGARVESAPLALAANGGPAPLHSGLLGTAPLLAPAPDRPAPGADTWATLHEVLTGRSMVLLVGGLVLGVLMGRTGWAQVSPFFDAGFKGVLVIFLLDLGMTAADRLGDLRKVGPFLLAFGVGAPLVLGTLGVLAGHAAGLSTGGAAVLGAMAASASYIAAPPAVRATLPEANPTWSLTLAIGITFPFNLAVGIPLYLRLAQALGGG